MTDNTTQPQQQPNPSAGTSNARQGEIDWKAFIPGLAAGLFIGLVVGVLAPTILTTPNAAPPNANNYRPPAGIAPETPDGEDTRTDNKNNNDSSNNN